jgi:hypothetical protein
MARKSRRSRKRSQAPRLSPAQLAQPSEKLEGPLPAPARMTAAKAPPDLRDEYRYVVTDLKRIAIIAAVMMAVMIALALLVI